MESVAGCDFLLADPVGEGDLHLILPLFQLGKRQPLDVKVGNRVLFAKYAGTEIKQNGTKYLIMRESDILAIVK